MLNPQTGLELRFGNFNILQERESFTHARFTLS